MSDESATIAPATSVGTTSTEPSSASTDAFRTESGNVKQDPNLKNAIFFYNILAGIGNKLEVDWESIAQKSGYKNAASAKVSFGKIKQKFSSLEEEQVSGIASPKAAVAKPRAKKEKTGKTVGSGINPSASKVTKKRAVPKKKSKASKAEENNEDMPDTMLENAQPVVDHNSVENLSLEVVEIVKAENE